jgi:hypothetical protein
VFVEPLAIATLAKDVAVFLTPFLPHLLALAKGASKQVEESAGKALGEGAWGQAKSLWNKLWPKAEAKPAAVEAVEDAVQSPKDEDAQAALRQQLKKLLTEDAELANEIAKLWQQAQASGIATVTVAASGERSVAVGGNVSGSYIVTGDSNTIK